MVPSLLMTLAYNHKGIFFLPFSFLVVYESKLIGCAKQPDWWQSEQTHKPLTMTQSPEW